MQIRAMRRAEMGQVSDLLAQAFDSAAPGFFRAQTERDSTFRFRHARVAVNDGRVAGYVRIFARTMLVRGKPTAVGGIGSVATHADARHEGVATALLRDAIEQMRRQGMAASFLFTGIPGFYERLGYHVVREPQFEADARAVASLPDAGLWNVRAIRDADTRALVAIYQRAIAGSTGAIVRTSRTWRDAQTWLDEDTGGCFAAERSGRIVAYVRSRCRTYGHQVLEAECAPGHDGAISALLAAVGGRALQHGECVITLAPDTHPVSTAMRSIHAAETLDVEHPMMVRGLDAPELESTLRSEPLRWWNSDRI